MERERERERVERTGEERERKFIKNTYIHKYRWRRA
jgi:hypothetical protein